jgi:hypothetical protein
VKREYDTAPRTTPNPAAQDQETILQPKTDSSSLSSFSFSNMNVLNDSSSVNSGPVNPMPTSGLVLQRQQTPTSTTTTTPATTATTSPTAAIPGTAWEDTPNLIGTPPVRDRRSPPNINIVEDASVYAARRATAEGLLERQMARADAMLDRSGQVTDFRYWFARVYQFVTEGELAHAAGNAFYYPSYVMQCVAYFEQIYNDNFEAFSEGGPVEDHWRQAFQEAENQKRMQDMYQQAMLENTDPDAAAGLALASMMQSVLGPAQSLVSSMQAHIRYDLPRAEAWVFNSFYSGFPEARLGDFRADFMSMSGVFDDAARRMNTEMADRIGLPVDLMPQLMQDTTMRYMFDADMSTERADTWRRAEMLVSEGQAGTNPYGREGSGDVTSSDNTSGVGRISDPNLRPTMDSSAELPDDDAVVSSVSSMTDAQIAVLPATERVRMLRGLHRGATIGSDETTVLRILNASSGADLVPIVDGADAWDMMYALDGGNATRLRTFFQAQYYGQTAGATAYRLIRKCLDGETAEWEEQMAMDILEARGDGYALVEQLGQAYGGPASGADMDFKNGLYKLEWQFDGEEENRLEATFGESGLSAWNF